MTTRSVASPSLEKPYPTRDGRPLGETDVHRDDAYDLIDCLQAHFDHRRDVYVSGNLLIHYERYNRRRHVAPDVFIVFGVPKHRRENYLLWAEGKGPDFVIELTSPSTRKEDQKKKYRLYRDVLRVREYFLFDPKNQYLKPQLQGHRLIDGEYLPIAPIDGRLPSEVSGMHLEAVGTDLRLYDPAAGRWLPTSREVKAENEQLKRENEALRRRLAEGD